MKDIFAILLLAGGVTAAGAAAPDWPSYAGRGFTVAVPPGWTVDAGFLDKGYGFFQGQNDDVRGGTALKPSGDIAPGTTLQSDQLRLVVQTARPGDLCVAASFLVDPPPDYETRKLLDKPEMVRTLAEPGDLYTLEQAVVLVSRTPCIAVHYYIAYARPRPGDPHASAPVDRDGLFKVLGAIAATVKPAK